MLVRVAFRSPTTFSLIVRDRCPGIRRNCESIWRARRLSDPEPSCVIARQCGNRDASPCSACRSRERCVTSSSS